MRLIGWLKNQ
jgi:hypothetical protein